jgi:hypothetical protein
MTIDRAAGALVALAGMAAIVWAASAPITIHGSDRAILRLAWSARPERIENCRQQTEEELARVPAHMRQPIVCEGVSAEYRLTVRHDGMEVVNRTVHGGGLRQDRRIYIFDELPLEPGDRTIEVRFERIDSGVSHVPKGAVSGQPGGETLPPQLALVRRFHIEPREVILVTYSAEGRALVGIEGSRQGSSDGSR